MAMITAAKIILFLLFSFLFRKIIYCAKIFIEWERGIKRFTVFAFETL